MYHYIKYDVFHNDVFVCNRVVRFLSQRHAKNCMENWQRLGGITNRLVRLLSDTIWEYRNVQPANQEEWMTGPNKVNHLDHVNYDLHLA